MLCVSNKKDKRALLVKNGLGVRSAKPILTKQQENERLDALAEDVLKVVKSYAQFQSRYRWIKTITDIQEENYSRIYMSHDKYSGRIYHRFTSTPRNIRPFMKLDGKANRSH